MSKRVLVATPSEYADDSWLVVEQKWDPMAGNFWETVAYSFDSLAAAEEWIKENETKKFIYFWSGEKFIYFWSGPFSQWHRSVFKAMVPTADGEAMVRFNCAEQYMMYRKAAEFGDWDTAKKVLISNNPKEQKALGRQVKPFDAARWNQVAKQYVYEGNLAKFTGDKTLYAQLMKTKGHTLVEASPYDKIWGIGLAMDDPRAKDRTTWLGTNWLGEVLTRLREDLVRMEAPAE